MRLVRHEKPSGRAKREEALVEEIRRLESDLAELRARAESRQFEVDSWSHFKLNPHVISATSALEAAEEYAEKVLLPKPPSISSPYRVFVKGDGELVAFDLVAVALQARLVDYGPHRPKKLAEG